MDLSGLPQFTIEDIRGAASDPEVTLVGRLSHLRGVRNDTAWLYRPVGPAIIGTVARIPAVPGELVEYRTSDAALAPELRVGVVYPWIDGYWQAYHVSMVLAGQWTLRTFAAGDARYFRLAGALGWQPAGGTLPEGAEDLGVREGGWDHEHCELCRAQIGVAGHQPDGYVDAEEHWLCRACYERYAIPRDVSFAAEA
jgi:hypothetical protein